MEDGGGLIDEADLAAQETTVYEDPPSASFHGHTVYATGLPSQGMLTLELLSLLDGFDLAAMGHNTIQSIHTMVEAKRLAFADRLAYVGDPEFIDVPLDELLSPEYAAERIKRIDPERAAEGIVPAGELGHSVAPTPSTSYFNVIDKEGNAVSFIHSLSAYWGSGFVAGDTGILFNDRAGRGFYLDEGHVNVIAPGKKTINTIHAYMVFKDDKPVLVGGTPGGDNQPQWNAQAVSNVIDHGMNVQQAADAPRWDALPRHRPAHDRRGDGAADGGRLPGGDAAGAGGEGPQDQGLPERRHAGGGAADRHRPRGRASTPAAPTAAPTATRYRSRQMTITVMADHEYAAEYLANRHGEGAGLRRRDRLAGERLGLGLRQSSSPSRPTTSWWCPSPTTSSRGTSGARSWASPSSRTCRSRTSGRR